MCQIFNPLVPGRVELNFRLVIFKLILSVDGWGVSCKIALRWISFSLTDDKSALIMAWCRQATSHYLSQCWPGSMSPYDVTRPQWVESTLVQVMPNGIVPSVNSMMTYCLLDHYHLVLVGSLSLAWGVDVHGLLLLVWWFWGAFQKHLWALKCKSS